MKIKSYFVNSVEAAIRQAQTELGPEAMLIESRTPSADTRHLGRFEVVFGLIDDKREDIRAKVIAPQPAATAGTAPAARTTAAETALRPALPSSSGRDDLAAELKMLRGQIDDLRRAIQPSAPEVDPAPVRPREMDEILQELLASDLDPDVAASLIETAEIIWHSPVSAQPRSGAGKECLREIASECIRSRIQTVHELNHAANNGNPIAFVGPPGGGKTTALAKIAVRHCLEKRRSVRIISVDTDRVGGHELLRAYCNVLGIGFVPVNSLSELNDAVNEAREKMYVLIDTPGFGRSDTGAARELAGAMNRITGREVHLVLPASMKRIDVAAYSNQYAMFKPQRLLFTKLDEAASIGSVVSETLRLNIPLSFFSTGQDVPEDLENANPNMLIQRLFPETAAPAASAA